MSDEKELIDGIDTPDVEAAESEQEFA